MPRPALGRLVLAVALLLTAACGSGAEPTATGDSGASTTPVTSQGVATTAIAASTTTTATTIASLPPHQFSDLPTITLGELPPEALDTLRLIRDGGPYPYRQDDSTFLNIEGLLPDNPRGFYREYTVDTPGLSHRGQRRLVTGDDGAIYWTDDHYASFRELVPG